MKLKRAYVWLTGLCLCVGALAGCGSSDGGNFSYSSDKDTAWTSIGNGVLKRCDGTTMVYASDSDFTGKSLAVVANAPECGGQ